jgi:uncharacterized protein YyaL (SSP411 family)
MKASLLSAAENPFSFGCLLSSAYLYIKKPLEITYVSKDVHSKKSALLDFINKTFIPNGILSIIDKNRNIKSLEKYSLFQNKSLINKNSPAIEEFVLVCREFTCSPPIANIDNLEEALLGKLSKEKIK